MEYTELEVEVLATSDKAALCRLPQFEDEEFWIPFSQIEDNNEDLVEGYEGVVYVTDWFCQKNGLN